MMSLDNAFVIFNNMPNRIELAEIDLQFPCEAIYFEVADYDELVSRQLYPQIKPKVREAFQQLFTTPEGSKNATGDANATSNGQLGITIGGLTKGSLNALDVHILVHCKFCYILFSRLYDCDS